uniref:BTB domain-containing protein n=1 Tax=Oryza brachyantha TaxID=4533 RepID=J3N2T3_ORYBR
MSAAAPSGSASSIVADTAAGYHLLRIDGYSLTKGTPTGTALTSSPFTVAGHRWAITYYPNGNCAKTADHVSLYLLLLPDEKTNTTKGVKVQARFQFRFAGRVTKQSSQALGEVKIFGDEGSWTWGYRKFIKRADFEKSKDLRDDSFTVRCDIVVVREIRAEKTTEVRPANAKAFVSVPASDMGQQLGDLLASEKGADVVFQVGAETFAAHRCVLAARSPVFAAELYGPMKEGDAARGVVRVEDVDAHVFGQLLRFVYTDSLPETEEEVTCQHLLVAADRYDLHRLKLICEERLCRSIGVDTVWNILALADQHHCDGLKKACFQFLGSPVNLSAVVAADGLEHLSRSCPCLMKELLAVLALPRGDA